MDIMLLKEIWAGHKKVRTYLQSNLNDAYFFNNRHVGCELGSFQSNVKKKHRYASYDLHIFLFFITSIKTNVDNIAYIKDGF